ncbi:hypothetical protein GCM10023195_29710 [Actinoallomurus liliacearum]|uniref:Uncharacterized protein n=1 Tax=Actinoallomurus liliacearum TaxID=1080073 RepID=A0ABP8TGQ2_9ACTN
MFKSHSFINGPYRRSCQAESSQTLTNFAKVVIGALCAYSAQFVSSPETPYATAEVCRELARSRVRDGPEGQLLAPGSLNKSLPSGRLFGRPPVMELTSGVCRPAPRALTCGNECV